MLEVFGREAIDVAANIGETSTEVTVSRALNAGFESNPDGDADESERDGEDRGIGGCKTEADGVSG